MAWKAGFVGLFGFLMRVGNFGTAAQVPNGRTVTPTGPA
jgi:hypothetical protein